MARKLTEEELSKVTGGASVAWGCGMSPGASNGLPGNWIDSNEVISEPDGAWTARTGESPYPTQNFYILSSDR